MRIPAGLLLILGCSATSAVHANPAPRPPPAALPAAASTANASACTRGDACWVTRDGFRFIHPTPIGTTLRAVRVTPEGDVWIAGEDATLIEITRDRSGTPRIAKLDVPAVPTYAETFEALERGASKDFPGTDLMKVSFKGLAASSSHDVWVALGSKYISHWDGRAWHRMNVERGSSGGDRFSLDGHGALWAVGGVLPFGDQQHGESIDAQGVKQGPVVTTGEKLEAIARDGEDVWVGSTRGNLWRSHAGAAFAQVAMPDQSSIDAISAHYVLTSRALCRRSGEKGTQVVETRGIVRAMLELPGDVVWVVGDHAMLVEHGTARDIAIADFIPGDHAVMTLDSERFEDVDGRAADDVWMVGRGGEILHWDGTALRELRPHLVEDAIAGVVSLGADAWLAAARDGTLIEGTASHGITSHVKGPIDGSAVIARTNAGEIVLAGCHADVLVRKGDGTWSKLPKLDGCIRAIGGVDAKHLWAVGSKEMVDGKAWRLVGSSWQAVPTGLGDNDDLNAVAAASNGDVWIAGDGALFLARASGALKRIAKHASDDYRGIALRAPDDVWLATDARDIGSAGTLLHWDGKRLARFARLPADGLHAVAVTPGGELWAVGLEGVATHSTDGHTFKGAHPGAALDALAALPSGGLLGVGRLGAVVQR